jgi:hypothetical protein
MQSDSIRRRVLPGAFFFVLTVAIWVAAFELNQTGFIPVAFAGELVAYWWLTRKPPRK